MQGGGGSGSGGGSSTNTPNPPASNPNEPDILSFLDGEDGRTWAAEIWPEANLYPADVRFEYSVYSTDVGYQTINAALRQIEGDTSLLEDPDYDLRDRFGNPMDPTEMLERIRLMDAGMEQAPEIPQWVALSRGTRWHEFQQLGITGPNDDLSTLVGQTYVNHSYTSASVAGQAAMAYMDVQVTINTSPGVRTVHMAGDENYGGALSSLPSENEMLIARGTEYVIQSAVKGPDGKWHVVVVALP